MRIGINATSLPICPAGAGRYLCNLIKNLAKVDANNKYFIFLKRRDLLHFSNLRGNFDLIGLPNFSRIPRIAWEMSRPKYFSKKMDLDVWHSPHYIAPIGLHNTKLIVTIHDLTFFLFPQLYSFSRRFSFQKFINQAVNHADALITVSHSTQNDLTSLFPQAEAKITTIHSGIEPYANNGYSIEQKSRINNNLTDGYPYILLVGTLERRKNVPLLISAFSELVQTKGIPQHLVIVGQAGNDLKTIRKVILNTKLKNRIHLTGYLKEKKLKSLYQSADMVVCPSLYEGFGFPVLEAMAYGVPTLCSDVGATAEIANCPEMCFQSDNMVDLFNKMHRVLSDVGHREDLVTKGISRARDFSWEKTATETKAIYEQVCGKKVHSNKQSFQNTQVPDKSNQCAISKPPAEIREAIMQTLIFSDLFDYPLTLEEIHRDLIGFPASFIDIQTVLENELLKFNIKTLKGYFFLKGRQNLVALRLQKKEKAQKLLQKNLSILNQICRFPFVQAVALSGTMAFENVNGADDIDLFLIVDGRRTWTTYLLLVLFMKLTRKRRVMCLNYLEGYQKPTLSERNFFTAHQIAHLLPLSGNGELYRYWQANKWIYDFLPHARLSEKKEPISKRQKSATVRFYQKILVNSFFNPLENLVYKIYSNRIQRITKKMHNSRIWIDPHRIQLFTNDNQDRILTKFNARLMSELAQKE